MTRVHLATYVTEQDEPDWLDLLIDCLLIATGGFGLACIGAIL